jgi:predicted chitinase
MPLTVESLADVMDHRLRIEGYETLFPSMNSAMIAAGCNTVQRAAAWHSQIGHESGGLRWMTELGDNCENYEGRGDLGNTEPGDGCRYKGRGPIQITGRGHYATVSEWAFGKGFVPSSTFFVDNPEQLAEPQYGFLGAVWYWTVARPNMNDLADDGDIEGVTRAVNGGINGLENRERIYNHALEMGDAVVPDLGATPPPAPNIHPHPDWYGDPTFIVDALRAFGIQPVEYEGWRDRGHGDFGSIWGVVWHHTGNINETDDGIAHHPQLGLAANMLIHPDGRVVLTGVGVAWHAGVGCYPGIPEDGANQVTIGIECAYGPDGNGNFTIDWPEVQVQTMVTVGAALTWFLGLDASRNIAHKEWAGADNPLGINKQGKPDPAHFDMNWFRDQIAARVAAGPTDEGHPMADPRRRSQSIYRQDDESIGDMETVVRQNNGMIHETRVEQRAVLGDQQCLAWVKAVADGKSPVQDELPDWAAEHAKSVLAEAEKAAK